MDGWVMNHFIDEPQALRGSREVNWMTSLVSE